MSVTLPDGTVITDDANPTTGLKAGGHRTRFYPCLSAIATWAAQVQSWAAQAQAAAGTGGGTIFPAVNASNAGQSLVLNASGTAYLADASPKGLNNLLWNGDFTIWQDGTTIPIVAGRNYLSDMCYADCVVSGNYTVTRQSGYVTGSQYCQRVQRNAGSTNIDGCAPVFYIPSEEVVKMRGKTFVLDVWSRTGANFSSTNWGANALNALISCYTDFDAETGFISYLADTIVQSSTSGTRVQIPITIPNNTSSLRIGFRWIPLGTAGVNDYFDIGRIRVYEGTTQKPVEFLPEELVRALCYRTYQVKNFWIGGSTAPTVMPINMKATPTISGGGAGFTTTNTSKDILQCYQTTPGNQTIKLSCRP